MSTEEDVRQAESFIAEIAPPIEVHLRSFLARKLDCVRRSAQEAAVLVEAIEALTTRGGKRLRPALVIAGHRAARGTGIEAVLDAAIAVELFQTYLLIQDDWMDGDETRRGGPAIHVWLRARHGGEHLAASAAILASDLANASAVELLAGSAFPADRVRAALGALGDAHTDVIAGQYLDLTGNGEVETVHTLKTASYTVLGPLRIGALLAGATSAELEAIDRYGRAAGIAFQLRDDLLGTFGDEAKTGKPSGADLRAGKRTALVAEARRHLSAADRGMLEAVLGRRDAPDLEIARVKALLESSGVRAAVEARIEALVTEASAALESAHLAPSASSVLRGLAHLLAARAK